MNENFLPLQNVLEIANQVIDWWGQKAQQHYIINFVSLSPQFMPNAKLLSFYFLFFPFNLWNSCNPWAETKNKLTNKEKTYQKTPWKSKNETKQIKPLQKTPTTKQQKNPKPNQLNHFGTCFGLHFGLAHPYLMQHQNYTTAVGYVSMYD